MTFENMRQGCDRAARAANDGVAGAPRPRGTIRRRRVPDESEGQGRRRSRLSPAFLALLGAGTFLLLLLVGGGVLAVVLRGRSGAAGGNRATPENFARLSTGMSQSDLHAVLGPPAEIDDSMRQQFKKTHPLSFGVFTEVHIWRNGDYVIKADVFGGNVQRLWTEGRPPGAVAASRPANPGGQVIPPPPAPAAPPTTPPTTPAAGGVAGRTVDLIPLLDPRQDANHGRWSVANGVLRCDDMHGVPRVQVPYRPPVEYDFVVTFSQPRLRNGVSLVMPNPAGGSFFWFLGGSNGGDFGFAGTPDRRGHTPGLIRTDTRYTTTVQVRRDGVRGLLDGRVLIEHRTDFRDLRMDDWHKLRDTSLLGVCCDDPTVFYQVGLVEVTGTGARAR